MDQLLRLIDALRERGAVKIATPEVTVEFAAPVAIRDEDTAHVEPKLIDRALDPAEVERLMYVETSKM